MSSKSSTVQSAIDSKSSYPLPQYFELLMINGYDDFESIADCTVDDLELIGIHKIGHKNKLMKYVALLKNDKIDNKIDADSNNEAKVNEIISNEHDEENQNHFCFSSQSLVAAPMSPQYNIWSDTSVYSPNLNLSNKQSNKKVDII